MEFSKKITKIAILQMTSTANSEENFKFISKMAYEASSAQAKMLFLPENFHFFRSPSSISPEYEYLDGKIINNYKELAQKTNLWLSLGGFQEKIPSSSKIYNTHIIINNSGEIISKYRKLHLFDVQVNSENSIKESDFTEYGSLIENPIDSPIGKLGLSICYDLRFPELYRKLALKGAENLIIPAAFLKITGKDHWEILLRARAIENQCFVIAAAQCGKNNEKRECFGYSMVVDPWGKIILNCEENIGLGFADIDLEKIQEIRKKIPCFTNRRNDIYGDF